MKSSVVLTVERPESIALPSPSNLVKLSGQPDVAGSYHESTTSSKPLSLNPDFFMKGVTSGSFPVFDAKTRCRANVSVIEAPFTKEVWGQRCIRYLDCFNGGAANIIRPHNLIVLVGKILPPRWNCDANWGKSVGCKSPAITFKAVSIPIEYRGDNVPHSLYQPHSGSNPAGSCGQKVSSRALITALQASKGSELGGTL